MAVDLTDVDSLLKEFEKVVINFHEYHTQMDTQRDFYLRSAFYKYQSGQDQSTQQPDANLLRVFADKNIQYTGVFPKIKVPTPGADDTARRTAGVREKILYGVWRKSGGKMLQRKWAYDGTIRSIAIAETVRDLQERCVYVRRHSPLKCFWQISNDSGEMRVTAFWAVFAVTKEEAKRRYNVNPTSDIVANLTQKQSVFKHIDGQDWFSQVIRWDAKTRVQWIGNEIVEEPHNHLMGEIPIDVCAPFESGDDDTGFPAFYLSPLLSLQAELNDVIRRRSRIVHRMSSPVVWARGLMNGKLDDFEEKMSQQGGGLLGLAQQGELGLLQVNDTRMLNEHEIDIITQMMRICGYGNASFGESVGANTSGDALAMYFNATQRMIEHQMIAWTGFHESINRKILKAYEMLLTPGEQVSLDGFFPHSTVTTSVDEKGLMRKNYQPAGAYSVSFSKEDIAGNYISIAEPPTATPKNELAQKREAREAVRDKFLSRTTGYEEWGVDSPEDELALLEQEQSSPMLNPDGVAKLMQNAQQQQPGLPPPPQPAPITPPGSSNGSALSA